MLCGDFVFWCCLICGCFEMIGGGVVVVVGGGEMCGEEMSEVSEFEGGL